MATAQDGARAARDGSAALLNRLEKAALASACDDALADELRRLQSQSAELSQSLQRAQDLDVALRITESQRAQIYRANLSHQTLRALTALSSALRQRLDVRQPNSGIIGDLEATASQPIAQDSMPPATTEVVDGHEPARPAAAKEQRTAVSEDPATAPQPDASTPLADAWSTSDTFAQAASCLERAISLNACSQPSQRIPCLQQLSVELHSLHATINSGVQQGAGEEEISDAEWKRHLVTPVVLATTLLIQTLWRIRPKSQALVRILSNINKELKSSRQPVLASIRVRYENDDSTDLMGSTFNPCSERMDELKATILTAVTPLRLQSQLRWPRAAKALWFALACYPCGDEKQSRARVAAACAVYKKLFRAFNPSKMKMRSKYNGKLAIAFLVLAIHVDIVVRFAPQHADEMAVGIERIQDKLQPFASLFQRQTAKLRKAKTSPPEKPRILDLECESRIIRRELKVAQAEHSTETPTAVQGTSP